MSQTSPRSGIRAALDAGKLGIYPHAFAGHFFRELCKPCRASPGIDFSIHPFERPADKFRARNA